MRFRSDLAAFKPYTWEPSDRELAEAYGLEEVHRFDKNTTPFTPKGWMEELKSRLSSLDVNRYPDAYQEVREMLSEYTGVDEDGIILVNGGDEGLDVIFKALLDPGDEVIVSSPTYSLIGISTVLNHGEVREVLRRPDFRDDADAILEAVRDGTKLIALCSPNNPTANTSDRRDVLRLLESGLAVLVDEAYYEFSGKTFSDLLKDYENLIILRTFSKAFCLAGARVGYLLADPRVALELSKVKPPNSVSIFSLELAKIALEHVDEVRKYVEEVVKERDRCIEELKGIEGLKVYPSESNFILLRFEGKSSREVHDELLRRGLVVRDVGSMPMLEGCIRFSVGRPEEDDLLLDAIKELAS